MVRNVTEIQGRPVPRPKEPRLEVTMEGVLEPEFEVIIKRKGQTTILIQARELELEMAYETKNITNGNLEVVHQMVAGRVFNIKGRM